MSGQMVVAGSVGAAAGGGDEDMATQLITNGHFEVNIDGVAGTAGASLSHETGGPITGLGSLHVVTDAVSSGRGAEFGGTGFVVPDNAILFFGMYAQGVGTLRVRATYDGDVNSGTFIPTLTLDGSNRFYGGFVVVPPGAGLAWLYVATASQEEADFLLDDVSLVQLAVA